MVTVLCVLRSGRDFGPEHVQRLALQVLAHVPCGVRFKCLTDTPYPIENMGIYPLYLSQDWPGWWSKMEAFTVEGPCIYLDLDVSVVGDLAPLIDIAHSHELVACGNFYAGDPHILNSSVMAWRGGTVKRLYRMFLEKAHEYIDFYRTPNHWGDQAFIADHWGTIETWQDLLPGMVVSFKRGVLMGADLSDTRIVVSHGTPRPWEATGADHHPTVMRMAR